MRLTELLMVCSVLVVLLGGILSGVKRGIVLSERAIGAERKAMCLEFVSESFRATCNGGGFESFSDWQVACRAMYDLDYIGFGEAESFMEDEAALDCENDVPTLYYAAWTGPYGGGEVYERKRK